MVWTQQVLSLCTLLMVKLHGISLRMTLLTIFQLLLLLVSFQSQQNSPQLPLTFKKLVFLIGLMLTRPEQQLPLLNFLSDSDSIQQESSNFQMLGQEFISLISLRQSLQVQFYTKCTVWTLPKNLVE